MAEALTPLMRQYRRIKGGLTEGVILFFRLGDFYEMFHEDARQAAPILEIALTRRNNVPMCGVPAHALDGYVARLIRAGRKVAICDQIEDPAASKGIVRREVTRVITPGTVTEETILESNRHNFLAGVLRCGDIFGLAWLDLSTGLFQGEEFSEPDLLRDALLRLSPRECVLPSGQLDDADLRGALDGVRGMQASSCEDWACEYDVAHDMLVRHFGVRSLEGFGCEDRAGVVCAAGAVLRYVKEELRRQTGHVRSLRVGGSDGFMVLDEATCRNLDLVPVRGKEGTPSLLDVLDVTRSAMGARAMRTWLLQPLTDTDEIRNRHQAVETLCRARGDLAGLREKLGEIRDLERLVARLGTGSGNARDLQSVGRSLACLAPVRDLLAGQGDGLLNELGDRIVPLPDLQDLIARAIVDEPPATLRDGGMIRDGYSEQLDELRGSASEGRRWLAEYQAHEQERSGIKNLKVRHNKVFGYYIEVSKAQIANVPEEYVRKQTLVNAERFITPELKEYEGRILGAQERALALETELLSEVRDKVVDRTAEIQATAAALGAADVLAAFADRSLALGYSRPVVTGERLLKISAGRHPVIEQMPDAERFVPNDVLLDCEANQLAIITGPNMAGKSTYIRQVALIVVLAQTGCFVPADEALIGVVDRVFTRVGASDDLARGRSTFMVEMEETANILNNATGRSLIVLDEIGRGTSTFDGISIAWAVAEYLLGRAGVRAKTLFATHYHELTDLARTMAGVKNYNVLVREHDDHIVFLRRIVPGGADKSYGIQVARLAGLPAQVIDRAKEILANLEEGELGESGQPKLARRRRKDKLHPGQMSLFGAQNQPDEG